MTGFELGRLFKQRIDEPYTGYYDNAKLNSLFKTAYIQTIQDIYNQRLNNQNAFDEMSFLMVVGASFIPKDDFLFHASLPVQNALGIGTLVTITTSVPHRLSATNQITISGLNNLSALNGVQTVLNVLSPVSFTINSTATGVDTGIGLIVPSFCIPDYLHYLWGEASFFNHAEKVKSTTTSPVFVSFHDETEIRTGDYLKLSGGLTGNAYAKYLNDFKILLYTDPELTQYYQSPTAYTSGYIKRNITSVLKFKRSDEKGQAYGVPTMNHPFFQQGQLGFHILPSGATEIKLDYIRKQPAQIDVSDNTVDLEHFYPYYFLEKIADYAARIAGFEMRDGNLVAGSTEMIVNNP